MKSKGPIPSTVIRSKLGQGPTRPAETSSEFLTKLAQKAQEPIAPALKTQADDSSTKRKPVIEELLPPVAPAAEDKTAPRRTVVSPKYSIVHRGIINDYQKFTNAKEQQGGARPDALVVRIELPLVESVSQIELDTLEKTLELSVPLMYKLNLDLPFPVVHDKGTAQWEKTKRELVVTLPVVPPPVVSVPSLVSDVTVESTTEKLDEETEIVLEKPLETEVVVEPVAPPRRAGQTPQTRVPVFHMRQQDHLFSIMMPLSGSKVSDLVWDVQDSHVCNILYSQELKFTNDFRPLSRTRRMTRPSINCL
jgi:dynein assembly factor 2